MQVPHEKLQIKWRADETGFDLNLPWMHLDIDVDPEEKDWIKMACHDLHQNTSSSFVQKFLNQLKEYPISYQAPRILGAFNTKDLQPCPKTIDKIDFTTPKAFVESLGVPLTPELEETTLKEWTWDLEDILKKSQIEGTNLYDPLSVITYIICYRLDWENQTWSGQDGLGQYLDTLRQEDEERFFRAIGWISRQSHYVTTQFHISVKPALTHFEKGKKEIMHFIQDEVGHHKFMEQVLSDLGFKGPEDFELGDGTRWMLDAFELMGKISPLAFSAMINIFEAAYYEGKDPISRVVEKSSKPHAAKGYDLHYKINQEHRHCDMPLHFAKHIAPQTKDHVQLTVHLFEVTLNYLDQMEKNLDKMLK